MNVIGFTEGGSIRVELDGVEMNVPDDMSNRHRQLVAEWEAAGNTIRAYELQTPTEDDYRLAIQTLIDSHAQSRRYDSGNSLATYATSTIPQWAAEATAFVAWRDAVWAYAYAEMGKVLGAEREQPTVPELLAELPEMVWLSQCSTRSSRGVKLTSLRIA